MGWKIWSNSVATNALWGIMKNYVKQKAAKNVVDLKETVINAFEEITIEILEKIHLRTFKRFNLCIEYDGRQIDAYDT